MFQPHLVLRRVPLIILPILILSLILAACDSGPAPNIPTVTARPSQAAVSQPSAPQPTPSQGPVARVNGQEISMAAYQKLVAQFQAAMVQRGVNLSSPDGQAQLTQTKQQLLDNMIDDMLMAQAAAAQGVAVSDADLNATMQKMISDAGGQQKFEQLVAASGMTLDDARTLQRTQMLNNLMRDRVLATVGTTAEQVHARHILVDSQATAQALLAQIQAGADFGQVAQQSSLDTVTKASGGDLGWFARGTLPSKELEDAAFALQPGQISGVIQSAFGYHILQVLERDPARPLQGEQLVKVQQQAVENWLNDLRAKAKVEILIQP